MKTIKWIIALSLFILACKKEMQYKPINFDYADHFAGSYNCIDSVHDAGPNLQPNPEIDSQNVVTINVFDLRNDKQCLFYIDYLQDTVIVLANGYFYRQHTYEHNDPHSSTTYDRIGFFRNDSLYYKTTSRTDILYTGPVVFLYKRKIVGKRQ